MAQPIFPFSQILFAIQPFAFAFPVFSVVDKRPFVNGVNAQFGSVADLISAPNSFEDDVFGDVHSAPPFLLLRRIPTAEIEEFLSTLIRKLAVVLLRLHKHFRVDQTRQRFVF